MNIPFLRECPFRGVFRVLPPVGRENTDDDLCGLDTTLEGGKLPARNGKSFAALSQGLGAFRGGVFKPPEGAPSPPQRAP